MNETWKDIPTYEGWYQASNLGNIRSIPREVNYKDGKTTASKCGKILSPKKGSKHGYLEVVLVKNGVRKTWRVHKLVALTFLPNPNNYPCLNHINECKTDNVVENLEWCSIRYNTKYSIKHQMIGQYTLSDTLVATYKHYTDAGEVVNGNKHGVFKCCANKLKTYKGFKWKLIENH